jgi:hypothetical protein
VEELSSELSPQSANVKENEGEKEGEAIKDRDGNDDKKEESEEAGNDNNEYEADFDDQSSVTNADGKSIAVIAEVVKVVEEAESEREIEVEIKTEPESAVVTELPPPTGVEVRTEEEVEMELASNIAVTVPVPPTDSVVVTSAEQEAPDNIAAIESTDPVMMNDAPPPESEANSPMPLEVPETMPVSVPLPVSVAVSLPASIEAINTVHAVIAPSITEVPPSEIQSSVPEVGLFETSSSEALASSLEPHSSQLKGEAALNVEVEVEFEAPIPAAITDSGSSPPAVAEPFVIAEPQRSTTIDPPLTVASESEPAPIPHSSGNDGVSVAPTTTTADIAAGVMDEPRSEKDEGVLGLNSAANVSTPNGDDFIHNNAVVAEIKTAIPHKPASAIAGTGSLSLSTSDDVEVEIKSCSVINNVTAATLAGSFHGDVSVVSAAAAALDRDPALALGAPATLTATATATATSTVTTLAATATDSAVATDAPAVVTAPSHASTPTTAPTADSSASASSPVHVPVCATDAAPTASTAPKAFVAVTGSATARGNESRDLYDVDFDD